MAVYRVTTDRPGVPTMTVAAADLIELGERIAANLARHRILSRAVPYDAQVGDTGGAIHQDGLRRPITFTHTQER